MEESLGLRKLTDYLNQTKRQAENAIDLLNNKIEELSNENIGLKERFQTLENEREYYCNLSEQLKIENSKKWRLQERDDWKSLVESVQIDRSRLQDECIHLENEIEQMKAFYENEIALLTATKEEDSSMQKEDDNELETEGNHDSNTNMNFLTSPTKRGLHHAVSEHSPMSPRDRRFQRELEKTINQHEVEKKIWETERLSQLEEINRLKREVCQLRGIPEYVYGDHEHSSNSISSGEFRMHGSEGYHPNGMGSRHSASLSTTGVVSSTSSFSSSSSSLSASSSSVSTVTWFGGFRLIRALLFGSPASSIPHISAKAIQV